MSIVFVNGASGFVGSHVIAELVTAEHHVIAMVRDAAGGETVMRRLPARQRGLVELRMGEVTRPETLVAACAGADAIVHLAAIPRDWNGGTDLQRVNLEGTRAMLRAAETAGIRRFVYLGALGVEDDPSLLYASSKARAEAIVAASGLDWTTLKPSLLWGERDGFFNVVAGLVRISPGVVPVPGRGDARFQPLAVTDLARIVRLVLERPETIGRSFELGGPRYWSYREITQEVLRGMGRRRLVVPVPVPLIRVVAGLSERLRIPFPVATDQLRQLRLDNVGPIDGVRANFGFDPEPMEGKLGYLRRRVREQEPVVELAGSPAPRPA